MKTLSKEKIVFFHEGTLNGRAGAYAAFTKLQHTAQFEAIDYSTLNKLHEYDLSNKIVYIIGLSIVTSHLDSVCFSAKKVIFIDHNHSSKNLIDEIPASCVSKFNLVYCSSRASCCQAWKYFIPDKPLPDLYLAIEDVEMHTNPRRITNSDLICSGLSIHTDFISLTSFFQSNLSGLKSSESLSRLITAGNAHTKFLKSLTRTYVSKASYHEMLNKKVPILNIPKTFVSSCLEELCSKAGISVSYTDSSSTRYWSLRTKPESRLNAGKICALLGGGGSNHIGGFITDIRVVPEDLGKLLKAALAENVNKTIYI